MPDDGQPIPVDCTLIGAPSNVPVNPSRPRSSLTTRGTRVEALLGDVSRPPRISGTQHSGGVVASVGTQVDRHGETLERPFAGGRCGTRTHDLHGVNVAL